MPSMIDIVIPVRSNGNPIVTVESIKEQTFKDFRILVVRDKWGSANKARNHGFTHVDAPYVMFADDDIDFVPEALEWLLNSLMMSAHAAYAYGAYDKAGRIIGDFEFSDIVLRRGNFISTMSLIRTEKFPGFDPTIQRLQDWDLWLTMLDKGDVGVYCKKTIFRTEERDGISRHGPMSYHEAEDIILKKHKLGRYRLGELVS